MNGVEDRDRRPNFPSRALSVEHPAVLPAAAAAAEAAAAAAAAEAGRRRRRQRKRSCI
jgi:hypothetical protein